MNAMETNSNDPATNSNNSLDQKVFTTAEQCLAIWHPLFQGIRLCIATVIVVRRPTFSRTFSAAVEVEREMGSRFCLIVPRSKMDLEELLLVIFRGCFVFVIKIILIMTHICQSKSVCWVRDLLGRQNGKV
jgi:hypothetical protein